jgi:putative membrane fusion protein
LEEQKSGVKKANKKIKKILIILTLILIVIYIMYTIFLLIKDPTEIVTVENGKLSLEETDIGYIIRDEIVIQGENYKNGIVQIKTEGERVSKGESVFRYYSQNEDELNSKIADLDAKIQDTMSQVNTSYPTDVKVLEEQIDQKVRQLNETTDISKLTEYQKDISELVTKKANIAGDLSPKGSYLNQLIEERRTYESELNSGAEYITTDRSGIISYKVDGLEDVLKPTEECFASLTKEYLENLNIKTLQLVATSDECGKIIDNTYCYIATISNSQNAEEAEVGDSVKIRLPNSKEVSATIQYISKQEEGNLIILKIQKEVEELIAYRKISFDLIWWSTSGLKVPNQAIVEEDGENYVVRNRAGYLSKLLIKVKKQNENYSIVEPYTTDELKEMGYETSYIYSYKKISIYDEIIVNPDLEKVE